MNSKRIYPKFIFKKDLVNFIIKKLNEDYLHLLYTFHLETEIRRFIRSVERDNLHLTEEGDLEIFFSNDGFLKIHSKNGYQIEELI
jgi:hypothetical protein